MGSVHFKPWVGRDYKRQVNPRLMLLGESHYERDGKLTSQSTIELTRDYVEGKWDHRFWTNIMQVVTGRDHWDIDRDDFWAKVVFYNYIQEVDADAPGVAPTAEMFKKGEYPFFEVLNEHKPTHILILAKRLWDKMGGGCEGKSIRWKEGTAKTWIYQYQGGQAISVFVNHPSRSSPSKWHPLVAKFLKLSS